MFWREYGIAVAVALVLHGALLYWLAVGFEQVKTPLQTPVPKFIVADIVKLKAEQKPQPKKTPPPVKPVDKTQQEKAKQEKQQQEKARQETLQREKIARQKAEQEKQQQLAKQKAEQEKLAEKQRQEQAEKQKQARAEALLNSLPDETVVEQQRDDAADEKQVASYIGMIQQAIIANWSRPPSARNGMQVLLDIQMIPNGTIMAVNIVKGSGNDAFDRSAVAAVKKTHRVQEIVNMDAALFERYFRHYQMLFKPEDLRL